MEQWKCDKSSVYTDTWKMIGCQRGDVIGILLLVELWCVRKESGIVSVSVYLILWLDCSFLCIELSCFS